MTTHRQHVALGGTPRGPGAPIVAVDAELEPSTWGPEFYLWGAPAVAPTPGEIFFSRMRGDLYTSTRARPF